MILSQQIFYNLTFCFLDKNKASHKGFTLNSRRKNHKMKKVLMRPELFSKSFGDEMSENSNGTEQQTQRN